jgi:hypothetical protein
MEERPKQEGNLDATPKKKFDQEAIFQRMRIVGAPRVVSYMQKAPEEQRSLRLKGSQWRDMRETVNLTISELAEAAHVELVDLILLEVGFVPPDDELTVLEGKLSGALRAQESR